MENAFAPSADEHLSAAVASLMLRCLRIRTVASMFTYFISQFLYGDETSLARSHVVTLLLGIPPRFFRLTCHSLSCSVRLRER